MRKNFFDLDAYEDDDIVQEGTEIGSLDFKFDDDEPVVQEAVVEEEKGPDKEATEKEIVQEASDKLSPDQVDEFYGKLKDELSQDDDTVKEAIAK